MKKSIFCVLLALTAFLSACGEKETSDKKTASTTTTTLITSTALSEEITSTTSTSENTQETSAPWQILLLLKCGKHLMHLFHAMIQANSITLFLI
ncbi:MAG: hypothetical protein LBM93_02010 [Oscillospiraceae bacterium]|jgi:outer membrane lipoprotein-sorting protein|nr:hypothetical protein [Oscillospiraceae bacterium]